MRISQIFAALPILGMLCCACDHRSMPESDLVSYEYEEWGSTVLPLKSITLKSTVTGGVLTYKQNSFAEERTLTVDAEALAEVKAIMKKHRMYKYKTSYSSRLKVLDGYSWHLRVRFEDGTTILSGGSNAGPDKSGFIEVEEYLRNLY